MEKVIAYCGYDCTNCPVYQATKKKDLELLKIILYNANPDASIESIGCMGCTDCNNQNHFCGKCPIRLCAIDKKLENCGFCKDFPCKKLDTISPQTFDYLEDIYKRNFKNSLEKALEIATKAHSGQFDKVGKEYINHPIAVSNLCFTKEAKIVGLLHDVVEDTDITLEDLSKDFSSDIIEAIRLVTKTENYVIEDYYQNIKNNAIAREVKLADLTHNMDLSRYDGLEITKEVRERTKKYQKYYEFLNK